MTSTASPELSDLLLAVQRSTIAKISGMLPARIVSYDRSNQTASVEIISLQRIADPTTGEISEVAYPQLVGVPVLWQSAGSMSITSELSKGDGGFVIPNERSIDGWKATGRASPEIFARRFDISDCVFLPAGSPPSDPLGSDRTSTVDTVFAFAGLLLGDSSASQRLVRGDRRRDIDNLYAPSLESFASAMQVFMTTTSTAATAAIIAAAALAALPAVSAFAIAATNYKNNIQGTDYLTDDIKVK